MLPANLLPASGILLGNEAVNQTDLFSRIAQSFFATHGLDAASVQAALTEREKLGSTGLGHGVAIPHGRIKGLKTPLLVFVQMKVGINFLANDKQLVDLVFALLVPPHATQVHLEILSVIATMLSEESTRTQLRACRSTSDVERCLTQHAIRSIA